MTRRSRSFARGLQQQPDSFAMHLTLAAVLVLKGDYEAAIAEYEYLLKQNPGSLIVANNLASLLATIAPTKPALSARIRLQQSCENRRCHPSKILSGGFIIGEAITRVRLRCLNKQQLSCPIGP